MNVVQVLHSKGRIQVSATRFEATPHRNQFVAAQMTDAEENVHPWTLFVETPEILMAFGEACAAEGLRLANERDAAIPEPVIAAGPYSSGRSEP